MKNNLNYCPFCGETELTINVKDHKFGHKAYISCTHCAARGGTFIEETMELAIERVTLDWNQKGLRRSNTIYSKITKFIIQCYYDLGCIYYKIKNKDF